MNNELDITQLTTVVITAAGGIIAALLGLIGVVVADIIRLNSINKHLGFNFHDESLKENLRRSLGTNEKSLTTQLGVGDHDKSISAQLGVGNDDKSITAQLGITSKSVTEQHREMYDSIIQQTDKISSIYGILHDNQVRQDAENTSQANLAATMAAFQQNYVSVLNENSELKSENLSLKMENIALHEQITSLQARLEESDEDSNDEDMGL